MKIATIRTLNESGCLKRNEYMGASKKYSVRADKDIVSSCRINAVFCLQGMLGPFSPLGCSRLSVYVDHYALWKACQADSSAGQHSKYTNQKDNSFGTEKSRRVPSASFSLRLEGNLFHHGPVLSAE